MEIKINSKTFNIAHGKIYKILLVTAIIALIGTISTNIQQYAQYEKYIAEEKHNTEIYETKELLYEMGVIENKPEYYRTCQIYTPYNCLNIPVSIVFWTLAFFSVVVLVLSFVDLRCTQDEKRKLRIISGMAFLSSFIGLLYWATNFHWNL